MPEHVISLVLDGLNEVGKTVKNSKIAILGISYKPNVKDSQLTPIKTIYEILIRMGSEVRIYDPYFKNETVFGAKTTDSLKNAVKGVDCIIIGTAHGEFNKLDISMLRNLCNRPAAFIDTRHIIEPEKVRNQKFAYRGVGRA
jgi:UDP-N-acetyl-D-mannosaminuronate dehydrogenase